MSARRDGAAPQPPKSRPQLSLSRRQVLGGCSALALLAALGRLPDRGAAAAARVAARAPGEGRGEPWDDGTYWDDGAGWV